ncbi:hypothetical protein I317_05996 [Kwoniella heveanensis CBS 569]|nr:hypothetical protein I317_05996 [Kwoniella heveanensis CBS 569]
MDAEHMQVDPAPVVAAETDLLVSQLGEVLVELEEEPNNVLLIRRQIQLMTALNMQSEALDFYSRLASLVMLDEDTWLFSLETLISSSARPLSLDDFVSVLEKFDQAENDYFSIPILLRHLEFVVACYPRATLSNSASEDGSQPAPIPVDEDVAEFLSAETTRGLISGIVQRARGSLSESHKLWNPWLEWEKTFLEDPAERSTDALERIHAMYIERLATPHLDIDQTSSDYSTFCSQTCPDEYESRMVQATESSQSAKTKLSGEKRYGKTREDYEQQLAYATDLATQVQSLVEYATWESDARARSSGKGKKPTADNDLTCAAYERAVAAYAKAAYMTQSAIDHLQLSAEAQPEKPKGKGKNKENTESIATNDQLNATSQALRAYKDAEASIWLKYGAWAVEVGLVDVATKIFSRSVRACPHNGEVWCQNMLYLVTELADVFERSLSLGLLSFPGDRVADVVSVVLCRASSESRAESAGEDIIKEDDSEFHVPVLSTITRGLELVTKLNQSGDPGLKLEKFLVAWAESRAPQHLEEVLGLVQQPSKSRSTSYQMTLLLTDVLSRSGNVEAAREMFQKSIQRSNLDWPEAVYEAYMLFESIHGSLADIQDAEKRIEKEREKVMRRREKAAQEVQAVQEQDAGIQAAVASETVQPVTTQAAVPVEDNAVAEQNSAPADNAVKRDREHTTVLVSGLPKGVAQGRIQSFFTDCGPIRETTIISDNDAEHDAALVEFSRADAIPSALAKDRKKFDGQEIYISMLWRSTLFVTNFARDADDATLRQLFGQYGRILQTRWPSRKYADSRRFCYITMESPAAAQEALLLHGYKPEGQAFGMTVLVSDPSAKTKRSDAGQTTLFVGGLNAKTTENDVRALFREHGTIRHIKLGWNPEKKVCKGFAFVDMGSEAEAKACLQLHGNQFQGKLLKVEISDPNHANKKPSDRRPEEAADRRARSVRLANLPDNTQEGLLQQALEKVVPVKRLELFAKSREAVAELTSQADAGKLILRTEPFIFDGREIEITEQSGRPSHPASAPAATQATATATATSSAPAAITATSFAPRATRKGKVLAKPRPTAVIAAVSIANSSGNGAVAQAQARGQDDFRALVASKNKQREEKLADAKGEKRKSDPEAGDRDEDSEASKRART